ncbi:hypothetical protein [Mycobacterium sp. 23]|uniref:hypothetical protein n=1 Tax=Mycobacterium sp. 23 TaxID=3400424 RepID=UPI003AB0D0FD
MDTPEELAARHTTKELDEQLGVIVTRVQDIEQRCYAQQRDISTREQGIIESSLRQAKTLKRAVELREQTEAAEADERRAQRETQERCALIGRAIDEHRSALASPAVPTLLVSHEHLGQHAAALRDGRPFGAVEMRARVTAAADLGSAGAWHAGMPNEPRHLIRFAGIPVSPLTGRTAQVPAYTGPTAAAGVDESTNHGEYDDIAPLSLTALRYGRWTAVSSLANVVDDLAGINRMHAWGIAKDLDGVAVAAVETAAGTPGDGGDDLELAVRQAILTVAAGTYSDEATLVVVGTPATVALLGGTTPTDAADLGSVPVRFNGARLYPTVAATDGQLTVFAPGSFRCFQSQLQSASLIDPSSGEHKFGQWLHSTGVAEQIAGSAVAVDLGGS